jgi:hypothetical protein
MRATTATDARRRLLRLTAERYDARDAGLGRNGLYMDDLEADIAACRDAVVRLAVLEIATLRAELGAAATG